MGDAGSKSDSKGYNVPNHYEAATSCVYGAMAKAGNGLLEVTWQAGTSAFFFFQAEDGIRDLTVTGVQTCALPIWRLDDIQRTDRPRGVHHQRVGYPVENAKHKRKSGTFLRKLDECIGRAPWL